MTRPDYCPVGDEPCQSMCDAPCRTEAQHAVLMKFYSVDSLSALVEAQHRHIEKLQAKQPRNDQSAFTRVREG